MMAVLMPGEKKARGDLGFLEEGERKGGEAWVKTHIAPY
jgi:hypothetical protein